MEKAREMFKKIGYKRDSKKNYMVYYYELKFGREVQIEFNYNYKTVEKRGVPKLDCKPITLKEMEAINEQIKELGWNIE